MSSRVVEESHLRDGSFSHRDRFTLLSTLKKSCCYLSRPGTAHAGQHLEQGGHVFRPCRFEGALAGPFAPLKAMMIPKQLQQGP
jgi:hypothetical protein